MSVQVLNVVGVHRGLNKFEKQLYKRAVKAVTHTANVLKRKVVKNVSLIDHTQQDLNAMGNPYALARPSNPHIPKYSVHKQTGTLVDCIFKKVEIHQKMGVLGGDIIHGIVGADETKCSYVRHVIMGTEKMVSRDFLTGTLDDNMQELEREFASKL